MAQGMGGGWSAHFTGRALMLREAKHLAEVTARI